MIEYEFDLATKFVYLLASFIFERYKADKSYSSQTWWKMSKSNIDNF